MKIVALFASLATTLLCSCSILAPSGAQTMTKQSQASIKPAEAIQRLKDGNARFAAGRGVNHNYKSQVEATKEGQFPFASIVSCLDSRTSSEIIFDQGIGDVFNARVAGNIVNPDILGSLEYGSKVAGSKAILVVGHSHCGAIKGVCDHVKLGNLTGLLKKLEPALEATKSAPNEDRTSHNHEFVDRVAEENVKETVKNIRRHSSVLAGMEKSGALIIRGAMYDVETGKVHFLD